MNPGGLVLAACGLFAICGAGFDWEWFMNHRKARFVSTIFGRAGARVFYMLLGTGLVVVGLLMAAGIVQDAR
jgi:hypothetical protein